MCFFVSIVSTLLCYCLFLSGLDRQEQILSLTVTQLLSGMRAYELTSLEVVIVYCLRAIAVGELTNCVAEGNSERQIKNWSTEKMQRTNKLRFNADLQNFIQMLSNKHKWWM